MLLFIDWLKCIHFTIWNSLNNIKSTANLCFIQMRKQIQVTIFWVTSHGYSVVRVILTWFLDSVENVAIWVSCTESAQNQIKSNQISLFKSIWTPLYNEIIKTLALKLMIDWSYVQDIYSNICTMQLHVIKLAWTTFVEWVLREGIGTS